MLSWLRGLRGLWALSAFLALWGGGGVGLRAQAQTPPPPPDAEFDARFTAGLRALSDERLPAARGEFVAARELADRVSASRRPVATFAAELMLVEVVLFAGQLADADVHERLLAVIERATVSGAWSAAGAERLRLRALVSRWKTGGTERFRAKLPAADREWLMRADFFTAVPARRLAGLEDAARVLRFQLGVGTAHELRQLRELTAAAMASSDSATDSEWSRTILATLARYHGERRSLDRAQVFVERLPADESRVLRAWLLLQREDHDRALAIARQLQADHHPQADQLLGEVLERLGRYDEALQCYGRALAAAGGEAARAAALNGRGDCLLALGRLGEARTAYESIERDLGSAVALVLPGEFPGGPAAAIGLAAEYAETIKDLGRLAELGGDNAAANARYIDALECGELLRSQLVHDPFGASWLRIHSDQRTAIDGVLRTCGDEAVGWEVVHALELGRGRGALDLAARSGVAIDRAELQRLVERLVTANDPAVVQQVARELEALRVPSRAAAERATVPSAHDLRQAAYRRPDHAVLSWWFGVDEAWLLVLRGVRVQSFPLGPVAACRDAVAAAFRAVATPSGDPAGLERAANVLLPAAAREVVAGVDVVVAIADPAMARLPLAALPVDGQPLGVRHALVQTPSLAVLGLLEERGRSGAGTVVVEAPPTTELTNRLRLDPLQFAARECEAVRTARRATTDGSVVHLRGPAATFDGVVRRAPDLLHIAAHAIDCPGLPTQSVLLLADGPHAMGSLGSLELPGSLVVLSACSAAAGEQRGDEGVIGLVEGLFAAGARGVVAPVAAVNQQATADFMAVFHHELAGGMSAAAALRAARARLWANGSGNYAHPHYWGAFTLFGDAPLPRPPRAPNAWIAPQWLLVLGLALLGGWLLLPRQQRRVGLR